MFAFAHLITAWLAGKLYERVKSTKLSHNTWFFLFVGSILPDIDFLLDWTLGTELHRTITHSLLFAALAGIVVYGIAWLFQKQERLTFAGGIVTGIVTHLLLDLFRSQGVPLLWPSLLHFSWTAIGYVDPAVPSFLDAPLPILRHAMKLAIVDMAIGTMWIFWLWWRKKVEF